MKDKKIIFAVGFVILILFTCISCSIGEFMDAKIFIKNIIEKVKEIPIFWISGVAFVTLFTFLIPKTWLFEEKKEEKPYFLLYNYNNREVYKKSMAEGIIVMPNVSEIKKGDFSEIPNLKYVYFLNPHTRLGESAFVGCFKLEEVLLPRCLETIEPYTFGMCNSLKKVVIPGTIGTIKEHSFEKCSDDLLLEFECNGKVDFLNFKIREYETWGIKTSCKIKFQDWKNPKTIKDFLKELGEKEKTEQTAAQSDS